MNSNVLNIDDIFRKSPKAIQDPIKEIADNFLRDEGDSITITRKSDGHNPSRTVVRMEYNNKKSVKTYEGTGSTTEVNTINKRKNKKK